MKQAEKHLVGILAKYFVKYLCQTQPQNEEILNCECPYPVRQLNAMKGVTFNSGYNSCFDFVSRFLVSIDGYLDVIEEVVPGQPTAFKLKMDSDEIPQWVSNQADFRPSTLSFAIQSYLHSLIQGDNWPHDKNFYDNIIRAFHESGYVKLDKISTDELAKWLNMGISVNQALGRVFGEKMSILIKRNEMIDYESATTEAQKIALFDKEHGTKNGLVWVWKTSMKSHFEKCGYDFNRYWTGGPYSPH